MSFAMTLAQLGMLGLVVLLVLCVIAVSFTSYYNGVNDGYGAAREPRNPGYARARRWLREHAAYRWPELESNEDEHAEVR